MYITGMERADVEENVTAQKVGHERVNDVLWLYSKGHELRKLKGAVEKGRALL